MTEPAAQTICLIEDDTEDIFLFKRALRNCEILDPSTGLVTYSNGFECISYYQKTIEIRDFTLLPKLIICDINMPIMDGFEFLGARTAIPELACIPVVIMSTTDENNSVLRCYEAGANAVLVKANSETGMRETVNSLVHFWLNLNQTFSILR